MCVRGPALTATDQARLHEASLRILGVAGVAFHSRSATDRFRHHGFRVEGSTVFFSESAVQRALERVPRAFVVRARDPAKSVKIGGEGLVLAPGYGAPFVADLDGEHRPATLDDYRTFCRLVHTSSQLDVTGFMMVSPTDVPAEAAHREMLLAQITLSDKPFMGAVGPRRTAQDALEMARMVWGTLDAPVMISLVSSLAPLQFAGDMADCLMEYAAAGQPVIVMGGGMLGSTAPIGVAGFLVQQNAVVLAGICLAQLVRPGAPVVYGAGGGPLDMRTGVFATAAAEVPAMVAMGVQTGRWYGLPTRGGGALTDAHVPDMQAGADSALVLGATVGAGANFVLHACGVLGGYMAMSYEKFLVDEDLCGMVRAGSKSIDLKDLDAEVNIIREVGVGGQYLTHPSTVRRCRTEFHQPALMNRSSHARWRASGGKRIDQRACEALSERLTRFEKPDIDPALERDLRSFVHGAGHDGVS